MIEGGSDEEQYEDQGQSQQIQHEDDIEMEQEEPNQNQMENTQELLLGKWKEETDQNDHLRVQSQSNNNDQVDPYNQNLMGSLDAGVIQQENSIPFYESPDKNDNISSSVDISQNDRNAASYPSNNLTSGNENILTANMETPGHNNLQEIHEEPLQVMPNIQPVETEYMNQQEVINSSKKVRLNSGTSANRERIEKLKNQNYIGGNRNNELSQDNKDNIQLPQQDSQTHKNRLSKTPGQSSKDSSKRNGHKSKGNKIGMSQKDIFPQVNKVGNQRNQTTNNQIYQELQDLNNLEPVEIQSNQLGKAFKRHAASQPKKRQEDINQLYYSLPKKIRKIASKTYTSNEQQADITNLFRLANKPVKKERLITYDDKFEKWKKLSTANRYDEEIQDQFQSVKDILKQRVQFNPNKQKVQKNLENKCNLGYRETNRYKARTITIQQKTPIREVVEDYEEEEEEKEEADNCIKRYWRDFNDMYTDSLIFVKDENTFFVHGKIYRFSKLSLGLLDNKTKFRFFLVWLTTSNKFENFIILLISLNSIFLGIKNYKDRKNEDSINVFVEESDKYFIMMFTCECLSKILAQGFIMGRNSYLSDGWNWLDFIVVVTSLLQTIPAMRGVSGLRTFRLFRPLRSLTTMPSMKLLIGTLLQSVAQLGGIMGLAMFFFAIFAILGVSLWNGKIHYRCYATEYPDSNGQWLPNPYDMTLCENHDTCIDINPDYPWCNSRYELYYVQGNKYNLTLDKIDIDTSVYDLNYGITNFDNVVSAFLTIFQCITMEGWTKIMNIYEDTGTQVMVILYFVTCVIICSFFLLNLTIAVMLMKYEDLDKSQDNNKHSQELRQLGRAI